MAKTKIALLYERLSRDDELQGESFSIQNQKIMLEDFARRNGFPRFRHYTDDGVSGTRFDRPGFMTMMEEVEDGNVEAIIIKSLGTDPHHRMTRRISHERTGLYPCWRLLHPETETGKIAGQAHRQVWAYAAAVFERIPPCPLQQPVTLREAVFPPVRD